MHHPKLKKYVIVIGNRGWGKIEEKKHQVKMQWSKLMYLLNVFWAQEDQENMAIFSKSVRHRKRREQSVPPTESHNRFLLTIHYSNSVFHHHPIIIKWSLRSPSSSTSSHWQNNNNEVKCNEIEATISAIVLLSEHPSIKLGWFVRDHARRPTQAINLLFSVAVDPSWSSQTQATNKYLRV